MTFRNEEELQSVALSVPVGTLAFVMDTEMLLIRLKESWAQIEVSIHLISQIFIVLSLSLF